MAGIVKKVLKIPNYAMHKIRPGSRVSSFMKRSIYNLFFTMAQFGPVFHILNNCRLIASESEALLSLDLGQGAQGGGTIIEG